MYLFRIGTTRSPDINYFFQWDARTSQLELGSFKEDQRPYRSDAASHVGAAVLAHVARSGRSDAALRWKELKSSQLKRKEAR